MSFLIDKEMAGEFAALEKQANQLGNNLVKETSALDHKNENLSAEKEKLAKLQSTHAETKETLETKRIDLTEAQRVSDEKEAESQGLSKRVHDLQLQYQAVSAGVAIAEGDAESTSIADAIASMLCFSNA